MGMKGVQCVAMFQAHSARVFIGAVCSNTQRCAHCGRMWQAHKPCTDVLGSTRGAGLAHGMGSSLQQGWREGKEINPHLLGSPGSAASPSHCRVFFRGLEIPLHDIVKMS